jgi:hypothetical protein
MHKLMEYVCDELKEYERKAEKDGKLSAQDIEYVDKLAHIKKSLLAADEMWDDSEYSMAMDGSYGRSYNRSYARGRTGNVRRDAMGRYSRDGYSMAEDFRSELEELMHDAPNDQIKMKLQRIMSEM